MLAEVTGLDLKSRSVTIRCDGIGTRIVLFDYLVLAPGMQASYFGHDEFAEHAPSLKTIPDGEAIRAKILDAYEKAELTENPAERDRLLSFVLVGAGPTGVELAGSIAQLASVTLRSNFRQVDPTQTSVILLDGAKRILPSFAESLSRKAAKRLEQLGVTILTDAKVDKVDEQGVVVAGKRIDSKTVLWTAGVAPSPILKLLETATDRAGRVCVTPFLSVPDHDSVPLSLRMAVHCRGSPRSRSRKAGMSAGTLTPKSGPDARPTAPSATSTRATWPSSGRTLLSSKHIDSGSAVSPCGSSGPSFT